MEETQPQPGIFENCHLFLEALLDAQWQAAISPRMSVSPIQLLHCWLPPNPHFIPPPRQKFLVLHLICERCVFVK